MAMRASCEWKACKAPAPCPTCQPACAVRRRACLAKAHPCCAPSGKRRQPRLFPLPQTRRRLQRAPSSRWRHRPPARWAAAGPARALAAAPREACTASFQRRCPGATGRFAPRVRLGLGSAAAGSGAAPDGGVGWEDVRWGAGVPARLPARSAPAELTAPPCLLLPPRLPEIGISRRPDGSDWVLGSGGFGKVGLRHVLQAAPLGPPAGRGSPGTRPVHGLQR